LISEEKIAINRNKSQKIAKKSQQIVGDFSPYEKIDLKGSTPMPLVWQWQCTKKCDNVMNVYLSSRSEYT